MAKPWVGAAAAVGCLVGSAWGIRECPVGVADRQYCREGLLEGAASCVANNTDEDGNVTDQRNLDRCLGTEHQAYRECLARVCDRDWQDSGGAAPDKSDCLARRDQQIENCNTSYPGSDNSVMREVCTDGADEEYLGCRRRGGPNNACLLGSFASATGPIARGEVGAIRDDAPDLGAVDLSPSAVACAADVDRVLMRGFVQSSGASGEWIVLDDAGVGADGRVVASFDPVALARATRYSSVTITVDWYRGAEFVDGVVYDVSIVESGVDGDYDRDGVVDSDDLLSFMDSFGVAAPRADLTGDGSVDVDDLSEQLDALSGR